MKAACMIVQSLAPSTAAAALPGRLNRHATACLSCQAELARYGKLRRRLAAMSEVVDPAPQSVASGVAKSLSHREAPSHDHSRKVHFARVAAAAGAVAAATAGAVAIWRQSKGMV